TLQGRSPSLPQYPAPHYRGPLPPLATGGKPRPYRSRRAQCGQRLALRLGPPRRRTRDSPPGVVRSAAGPYAPWPQNRSCRLPRYRVLSFAVLLFVLPEEPDLQLFWPVVTVLDLVLNGPAERLCDFFHSVQGGLSVPTPEQTYSGPRVVHPLCDPAVRDVYLTV